MKKWNRVMAKALGLTMACAVMLGIGSISAQAEELTGKTAMEITAQMGKGWNLGNTFDANGGNSSDIYSQEQSWGNPIVTKELIDGVKAAGFNTIRIPVTWYKHIDAGNNYKIDDAFMARIKEVVDYAYDNDMYVILNVHHETWVNRKKIDTEYKEIGKELKAVWQQIADNFADYDQHLIFEGMNEPRAQGESYEWTGTSACYDAVNYLNQIFVETIRSNGKGNNGERALMIPGYAASSSATVLKSIEIPQIGGKQAENIIISVHCYSPYNFCLSDAQTSFDPNNTQDTGDITLLLSTLNSLFLKNDIPVVMGECGATNSNDNVSARKAWCAYLSEKTTEYGIPAVLWDNGAKGKSGGECHNYFNRKTGEMAYPELLEAFVYGDVDSKRPKDMVIDFEPYKDGTTTVMASPDQYGFEPLNMTKKAKVNHTEGASVGYSVNVTTDHENSYTTMDLSKFGGKTIRVEAYISSASTDTVSVGIIEGDSKEMVSTAIDGEWTKVTFCYKFDETNAERKLFFRGGGADTFYLDDISVTMIEDSRMTDAFAGKEGQEDAAPVESETVKESVAESKETSAVSNNTAATETAESSSAGKIIAVIVAALAVIAIGAGIVLTKKKKGPKAN